MTVSQVQPFPTTIPRPQQLPNDSPHPYLQPLNNNDNNDDEPQALAIMDARVTTFEKYCTVQHRRAVTVVA